MRHPYHLTDVFTDRVFGGNPLAVFPEAARLRPEHMPLRAREPNLSECAFVLPAADPAHKLRLRIFTPTLELPFAGHPTVGTACVLADTGRIRLDGEEERLVFEEGGGTHPGRHPPGEPRPLGELPGRALARVRSATASLGRSRVDALDRDGPARATWTPGSERRPTGSARPHRTPRLRRRALHPAHRPGTRQGGCPERLSRR